MRDRPTHRLKDREHRVEDRLLAADHDRERSVDRALLSARDRRVEHRDALVREGMADLLRDDRRDRGHVHVDQPASSAFDDAVLSERHLLDVGRVGEHRDQHLALRGDLARRGGGSGARPDELVHGRAAPVVDDERVSGLQEIFRHGASHDAESNESDHLRHKTPVNERKMSTDS